MTRYDLQGGKLVPAEHGEWASYYTMQADLERMRLTLQTIRQCRLFGHCGECATAVNAALSEAQRDV